MNASHTVPVAFVPSSRTLNRVNWAIVGFLWLLWQAIRLPTLAFLIIIEPVVRLVLAGGALLLVLTAFFYRFLTEVPHFPFWGMLGLGIGSMLLLMLYYALLRLLSGR